MVLGQEICVTEDVVGGLSPILLPMLIAGVGLLFSALSTYVVRLSRTAEKETDVTARSELR